MKRIVYDVPRWHAYLHREARGLDVAGDQDDPMRCFEDELFDRLYSGGSDPLPETGQEPSLRAWAQKVHAACEQLPAFGRLVGECRGSAAASAAAVESLMLEIAGLDPAPDNRDAARAARRRIAAACDRASSVVDELRDSLEAVSQVLFGSMPGTGTGVGALLPASTVRDLARRLRDDPRLRQIALLAGRFKRIAATKRRQKVRHGADEITDVTQGADLARLLPSELARLCHPRTRLALLRSLIERQVLEYQLCGSETLGKGPLVVAVDKSGSMDGPRDVWATALGLALLEQAQREKRAFALLLFDAGIKYEVVVRPGEPLPEDALLHGCAGGTSIETVLTRALDLVRDHRGAGLRKSDVVLVTDGGSDSSGAPALRERALALGVSVLGLGIGVPRSYLEPWCDQIEAVEDLNTVQDRVAETVFAA